MILVLIFVYKDEILWFVKILILFFFTSTKSADTAVLKTNCLLNYLTKNQAKNKPNNYPVVNTFISTLKHK